jgi:hypothetical protein
MEAHGMLEKLDPMTDPKTGRPLQAGENMQRTFLQDISSSFFSLAHPRKEGNGQRERSDQHLNYVSPVTMETRYA